MDIKTLLITFVTIFLAELGDKTQLATLTFSLKSKSSMSVFIGASLALVLSCLIAVIFGSALTRFVPLNYIRITSGLIFIILGVWMLISL
ncbi:MAG: hypothetical protein DRG39_03115 [Deltaproteobacteria bacterium]|nr:MAG: hypothetical protein DRG39_03115 [Deltaproteobacteria bacterium]